VANDRIKVQKQQQSTTARRRTVEQSEASKEELKKRAVALYEELCKKIPLSLPLITSITRHRSSL